MNLSSARLLVENLLERVELDSVTGKFRLGTISLMEKKALETLLTVESEVAPQSKNIGATPVAPILVQTTSNETANIVPEIFEPPLLSQVTHNVVLDLKSTHFSKPENPEIIACLDFGTSMSKAFAMKRDSTPVELALGKRAGASGYPVDSSLFISDDGILYFGPQAVSMGVAMASLGRVRFDSPKASFSMGEQIDLNRKPLAHGINPTDINMSEGEMITLYLAYLTDLAVSELEEKGYSRYCSRRFARPCWPEERNRWAEPLLKRMLAQAQILADTFHDRWQDGLPLAEVKQALIQLASLPTLPDYLLGEGVPEPVAAAASLMLSDEAQRELFLVIDVGAGTTDFGVFLLQSNPDRDICLVRIVPGTILYLQQAGNRIDDLLKFFVLGLEGVDMASPEGSHNLKFLQSTIRLHKEALCRDGIVEVPLANGSRVVVERDAFLGSQLPKAFKQLLNNEVKRVLEEVGDGYLDLMKNTRLNVVLTGGGADLPMIQELAHGHIEVRGRKIMRRPTSKAPTWISEQYPQFTSQYPQLAVAIGGANPELPKMAASFSDFGGLSHSTYTS